MRKSVRQCIPEIIFFCVTFITFSIIIRSQYHYFSDVMDEIFLNYGLHFSYWPESYRNCVFILATILISGLFFFLLCIHVIFIKQQDGKNWSLYASLCFFRLWFWRLSENFRFFAGMIFGKFSILKILVCFSLWNLFFKQKADAIFHICWKGVIHSLRLPPLQWFIWIHVCFFH